MVIGSFLSVLGCSAVLLSAALLDHADAESPRPPAANLGLRLADRPAESETGDNRNLPVGDEASAELLADSGSADPAADDSSAQSPDGAEAANPVESSQPLGLPRAPLGRRHDGDVALGQPAGAGTDDTWVPGGLNEIAQVGGALTLVVSLLVISRRWLARSSRLLAGGSRPSGVLEVLGRYPIGRGQSLVLLKFARRILLLHQSGAAMTMISELTAPEEVAALLTRVEAGSSGRDAMRFRSLLKQYQHEHDHPPARSSRAHSRAGIELQPENVSLDQDIDLVDLTRSQNGGWFGGLLGRKGRGS